jgi:hypothetical protein
MRNRGENQLKEAEAYRSEMSGRRFGKPARHSAPVREEDRQGRPARRALYLLRRAGFPEPGGREVITVTWQLRDKLSEKLAKNLVL